MQIPTLPTNLEAERAVIGSLLCDRDAIIIVAPLISSDDMDAFYHPEYRACYEAMLALYARRVPGDIITVNSELQRRGKSGAGGFAALDVLEQSIGTAQHVEYYVNDVLIAWGDRLMIEAGAMLMELGYSREERQAKVDKAQRIYDRAFRREKASGLVTSQQAGQALLDLIERGGDPGAPVGFPTLDRMLGGGLHDGDLVIVGALTSGGKTAFACQQALTFGAREQVVLYVSYEMKAIPISVRCAANLSGIAMQTIPQAKKFLDNEGLGRLVQAVGEYQQMPIRIEESFSASLADVRSKALALHAETGRVDLVIVDYLQQINTGGMSQENRSREVAGFSRGLKTLAGELNCPVIALSQFNREGSKHDGPPKLSELKESSGIEQDADVVLILDRPDLRDRSKPAGLCDVHVAKQRQGPLGMVTLEYEPDTNRWREPSYRPMQGY